MERSLPITFSVAITCTMCNNKKQCAIVNKIYEYYH